MLLVLFEVAVAFLEFCGLLSPFFVLVRFVRYTVTMIHALKSVVGEATAIARQNLAKGKSWGPTAAAWGGSAALLGLFLTDWKVITAYIPYYNGKYKHEVPR